MFPRLAFPRSLPAGHKVLLTLCFSDSDRETKANYLGFLLVEEVQVFLFG